MSETRQSLIKVYKREDGKTVLVYGSCDNKEVQSMPLECIVIDSEDAQDIAQALVDVF